MKNAKQRFDQRLATFKANLDGGLTLNGVFRGRMILKELRSKEETMARGESWSLGKIKDGSWVILHQTSDCLTAKTIPLGRSLKSLAAIIPLPNDLRVLFEQTMGRKSIAGSLEAVLRSRPVFLDVSTGAGKTQSFHYIISEYLSACDRYRMLKLHGAAWRL